MDLKVSPDRDRTLLDIQLYDCRDTGVKDLVQRTMLKFFLPSCSVS